MTPLGILTNASDVQSPKALPRLFTLLGIIIDFRDEQPWKALCPIFITLSGIVIECKEEHLLNASSSMVVTLLGMIIVVRDEQP
jgi:hypothetical protein